MGPWTGTVVFFFFRYCTKIKEKKKGKGDEKKEKKGCWSCRFSTDTHFARGRRDDKTIIATLNKGNVRSWRKPHVSLKHGGFLTNLRSHTLPMSQDFFFFLHPSLDIYSEQRSCEEEKATLFGIFLSSIYFFINFIQHVDQVFYVYFIFFIINLKFNIIQIYFYN
jgi:hypothetical protein